MYDFRVMDNQPASGQTCDHIGEPSSIYLPDGALQYQLVNLTEPSGICTVICSWISPRKSRR